MTDAKIIEIYTKLVKNFLKKNFDLELTVPVEINNRLTRSLGRFVHTSATPEKIEVSRSLIKYHTKEEMMDVLYHEAVHYACFVMSKPFHDGDRYFEETLKRLNVSPTNTIPFRGELHVCVCSKCGLNNYSSSKYNFIKYKYKCMKCKDQLTGEIYTELGDSHKISAYYSKHGLL